MRQPSGSKGGDCMPSLETGPVGAMVIDPNPHEDDRGRFMRAWCVGEFTEHGLNFLPVQANLGFTSHALPGGVRARSQARPLH